MYSNYLFLIHLPSGCEVVGCMFFNEKGRTYNEISGFRCHNKSQQVGVGEHFANHFFPLVCPYEWYRSVWNEPGI